jgi:hypothetical protein
MFDRWPSWNLESTKNIDEDYESRIREQIEKFDGTLEQQYSHVGVNAGMMLSSLF